MKQIEALLASVNAIEAHAKGLKVKRSRAVAEAYIACADQFRADAAALDWPLASPPETKNLR